jgi:hypothetical protein
MTVGKRILLAIVCGCFFATLLLLIAFTIEMPDKLRGVLLWNVGVFVRLAGIAPFIFIFEIYQQLVFGSPFAFLSHYELAYPTLSSLYEFSVSPSQ